MFLRRLFQHSRFWSVLSSAAWGPPLTVLRKRPTLLRLERKSYKPFSSDDQSEILLLKAHLKSKHSERNRGCSRILSGGTFIWNLNQQYPKKTKDIDTCDAPICIQQSCLSSVLEGGRKWWFGKNPFIEYANDLNCSKEYKSIWKKSGFFHALAQKQYLKILSSYSPIPSRFPFQTPFCFLEDQ